MKREILRTFYGSDLQNSGLFDFYERPLCGYFEILQNR